MDNIDRVLISVFRIFCTCLYVEEDSLTLIRFYILQEVLLILLLNLTIINIYFVSDKKKNGLNLHSIIILSIY